MKTGTWRVLAAVATAAGLAAAVAAAAMGGCDACAATTSTGACVPMTCHWTMRAAVLLEALAAVATAGLAFVRCKAGRRWLAAVGFLAQSSVLAAFYTPLMGLCGNAQMHCHATATVCTVLAAVAMIACVVAAVQADPDKADLPKRGL